MSGTDDDSEAETRYGLESMRRWDAALDKVNVNSPIDPNIADDVNGDWSRRSLVN